MAPDKYLIKVIFNIFLLRSMNCRYPFELPHWGNSNEFLQLRKNAIIATEIDPIITSDIHFSELWDEGWIS